MSILGRAWLFNLGSGIYNWFSGNAPWRDSCAQLATRFPQSNGRGPMRVLDLGCGPGVTIISLSKVQPDIHYVGGDLAPRMVRTARRETARSAPDKAISYLVADATALPFASNTFDATTGHSFLYLVPNRIGVLSEAYRVLRRGGRYMSMEPRAGQAQRGAIRKRWRDLRFLVAVALWRPYSKYHGQLDEKSFPALLQRAGFTANGTTPALDGLGIVGCGEK